MNPQEIEKLLGGYATDTLTEEERRTLFAAALGNQALFDALADEQALRELLEDPPSRAHLLAALREERVSPLARFMAWLRQPSVLALAAAVAAGIVTIAVVIPHKTAMEKPAAVAVNAPPQPEALQPQKQKQLEAPRESASEPKPAALAPVGSPRQAPAARREELGRDAIMARNVPIAGNTVAPAPAQPAAPSPAPAAATPAPPPPPPPAPVVVSPAQSQFKAAEEAPVAQSKLADSMRPAGAGGSVPQEARKKEAPPPSARDLYYATQAPAASGFVDQPKAGKAKQESFGRALSMRRAATPPPASMGGVRYSILRRNLDGSFAEVEPSSLFVPGDALRVRFETNQTGNLAVMERNADGVWSLRMAARTQPGQAVYMPSESTINVTAPGAFRFFVRFSRSLRGEPRLDQATPTPGLLRESAANSVYVVNPVAATDPVVDFELVINGR